MDKLNNDEMILIMLSMKKQYEEQYKIMENKFNSLKRFCKEEKNITLLNSGKCNCCDNIIYKICDDDDIEKNYYNCSGCNKVMCFDCNDGGLLCLHTNKFWCKKCNDFNIKMKELK